MPPGDLQRPLRVQAAPLVVCLLVAFAITLLSWHTLPLEPQPGLDPSWQAALYMALHDGITFGNRLIFTYGPLGFLSAPTLWYGGTGAIAVLYTVLVRFALALALFLGARRTYGPAVGGIVALLVAGASVDALESVPFLVFCVWMVDRGTGPRPRPDSRRRLTLALMAVGGAVAGLELLSEISLGIELAALAIVMALGAQGRRRDHLIVTLAALILALLAAWGVTGQDWGALPAYAHNSARIVSGYAAAMGYEDPSLTWEFTAGLVAFAFGLAGALRMTRNGPARRRWGIVALWVVFCFFEYKEGFVRHDSIHGVIYFVALMGGFLALRWRSGDRLVALGLTAALFTFALIAQQPSSFSAVFDPGENAKTAIDQLEQVSSSAKRAAVIAQGRREIRQAAFVDQPTLDLLQGHTVDVLPYQTTVAWAYNLAWRPLPVFQSYAAYTTSLDQENADTLNSTRAPQRILRNREPEVDGRVPAFDEGLSTRTILCRYRELRTTDAWQVLGLGPNRCGAPVPLSTVHAGWDQNVPVPAPPNDRSFVFVRIGGVAVGGLERLRALLYKPVERMVLLDGVSHRLIEGTATDGLLLRAPAGVDFTAPFNLAPDSSTIAVGKTGQGTGGGRPITFSFFAQAVSAGPRPVGAFPHLVHVRG